MFLNLTSNINVTHKIITGYWTTVCERAQQTFIVSPSIKSQTGSYRKQFQYGGVCHCVDLLSDGHVC